MSPIERLIRDLEIWFSSPTLFKKSDRKSKVHSRYKSSKRAQREIEKEKSEALAIIRLEVPVDLDAMAASWLVLQTSASDRAEINCLEWA